MPKLPRIDAKRAERLLLKAGFELLRTQGSHRLYIKGEQRVTVPHHVGQILHPKIVKQVFAAIEAEG